MMTWEFILKDFRRLMIIFKMKIMLNIQDDMARLMLRLIQKKSLKRYIRVCFLCLIIILKHICLMRQDIYGRQQDSEVKNPDLEAPALGYSWRESSIDQCCWSIGVVEC